MSNSSRSGLRGNVSSPRGNVVPPREDIYIQTAEIESRCLYSWDDSHQIHSEEVIIRWDYQAVKTTMKRLHHCIRLKVTGPVDVEGIAKSYVNRCVDYGLKKNSTRHAVEAIIALGADILSLGATGGTVTYAKILDYTKSVADNTMECLTDTDKIAEHVKDNIQAHFASTISNESEWVYWEL